MSLINLFKTSPLAKRHWNDYYFVYFMPVSGLRWHVIFWCGHMQDPSSDPNRKSSASVSFLFRVSASEQEGKSLLHFGYIGVEDRSERWIGRREISTVALYGTKGLSEVEQHANMNWWRGKEGIEQFEYYAQKFTRHFVDGWDSPEVADDSALELFRAWTEGALGSVERKEVR